MNKDLKKIKEKYGEKMMHLCRDLFSTLLEQEGLLFYLMESHFEFSKFLYDDLIETQTVEEFKNYIYSLVDIEKKELIINKTPKELLKEAGYDLYECKTEEEIQSFKKYYKSGEELCTFNGRRLERCYVFFAVKENANEIKREDFNNPKRQDEYGVSVISIQFSKGDVNTLSIKNRYNHTVNNPDATFSNNLDNIITGLTNSFARVYGFNINKNSIGFEIPGYIFASDGKYYKYNYEINNIYYCPNNIIIDNFEVVKDYQEKERYILLDYFILDLKNKEIKLYDNNFEDSFVDGLNNIKNIEVTKAKETKNKKICINDGLIEIEIDKTNKIISYSNEYLKKIQYSFLDFNKSLEQINLPNVKEINESFLYQNELLTSINLPKIEYIGDWFLYNNKKLKSISIPNIICIGKKFLYNNTSLISIELPKVEQIGAGFLYNNNALTNINLPNVKSIEEDFLYHNNTLTNIDFEKLRKIDSYFLYYNNSLKTINLPNVEKIGNWFLFKNNSLVSINLPNSKYIGTHFLTNNDTLTNINFKEVIQIGWDFLALNNSLISIDLSNVEQVRNDFLNNNKSLESITMPKIKRVDNKHIQKLLNSKQKVKRRKL